MLGNLPANSDDWIIIHGLLNLRSHIPPEKTGINCTLTHFKRPMVTSPLGCLPSGGDGQHRPCGKTCKNTQALWDHKLKDHSGQKTSDKTVNEESDQRLPCGLVCKNAYALKDHKKSIHSGQ